MTSHESSKRSEVLVERRGAGLWLRLNRPQVLNALTEEMLADIELQLDAGERDGSVRVIVLTGEGKAFCAGADLNDVRARTETESSQEAGSANAAFSEGFGRVLLRLERFRKPIVAAVNGVAVAAGMEIVLVCDFAIAAVGAQMGDAHSNYGLLPGGGSSVRLPRCVGTGLAKYLLYTGELLPAEDFVRAGLILKLVAAEQLQHEVDSLVSSLAQKSPLVLEKMKELVRCGLEKPTAEALQNERNANRAHAMSYDWREGLAAFAERRKPRFIGR